MNYIERRFVSKILLLFCPNVLVAESVKVYQLDDNLTTYLEATVRAAIVDHCFSLRAYSAVWSIAKLLAELKVDLFFPNTSELSQNSSKFSQTST